MKYTLLSLLLITVLQGFGQDKWIKSNTGISPDFYCYGLAAYGDTIYACGSYKYSGVRKAGLYKSINRGQNWQLVDISQATQKPSVNYILHHTGKKMLGAFFDNDKTYIMASTDEGKNWVSSGNGLDSTFAAAGIVELGDKTLITGGSTYYNGANEAVFYKSTDTGATWQKINTTNILPVGVTGLHLVKNRLYMNFSINNNNNLYFSDDTAVYWSKTADSVVKGSYSPLCIASETGINTFMLGTFQNELKIFFSDNAGQSWSNYTYSPIPGNSTLDGITAAIYHKGVFYAVARLVSAHGLYISATTLSVKTPGNNKLAVYPNPANNHLTINAENTEWQTAEVFSIHGQKLYSIAIQNQTVDISSLPQGMYVLKAFDGENYYTSKFIKE